LLNRRLTARFRSTNIPPPDAPASPYGQVRRVAFLRHSTSV